MVSMRDGIEEYYDKALEMQRKYLLGEDLNSHEFFEYYYNKATVALLRSFDAQDTKIKERLNKKWGTAFSRPMVLASSNYFKSLAEFSRLQITPLELLNQSKQKYNGSLIELGAMDYPI